MHFTYSPRRRINLDTNSWPHYQWQAWFPSHGMGFKFSHKVVAYLNNICAIFLPIYLVSKSLLSGFIDRQNYHFFSPLVSCTS